MFKVYTIGGRSVFEYVFDEFNEFIEFISERISEGWEFKEMFNNDVYLN